MPPTTFGMVISSFMRNGLWCSWVRPQRTAKLIDAAVSVNWRPPCCAGEALLRVGPASIEADSNDD
jgi:hypothetical protein